MAVDADSMAGDGSEGCADYDSWKYSKCWFCCDCCCAKHGDADFDSYCACLGVLNVDENAKVDDVALPLLVSGLYVLGLLLLAW